MAIIIKFLLKNIYEKKFRTFLIIFSVMLSSALYFASSAISDTMIKMYLDRISQYYGTSEILIHSNEKSPSGFFDSKNAEKYKDEFEYIIGVTQGSGSFKPKPDETVTLTLQGINLEDLTRMNHFVLWKGENLYPFTGRKIIISKNTSEKYNLKIGDNFEFKINNTLQRFQISGIALPVGPFAEDGQTTFIVIPHDTLSAIYNVRSKSTVIYLKLKNPGNLKPMLEKLSKEYSRYTVREPISKEDLQREIGSMSTPFMLMTIIVSFMSIFIIYTSFKVLTMERLPVIGTFRSIGATRKTTDFVMLAESTLYGIIGGALGCLLGIGILYIMAMNSPYSAWDPAFKTTIQFSPSQLITTFIVAVLLCFVSSVLPIIKASKIPVKEIVLNAIEKKGKRKKGKLKLISGIFLVALSILAPRYSPNSLGMIVDSLSMLLSVSGVVLLIPYLTSLFIKIFEAIYTYVFGNVGILAAKNLRENKSILNSIALLTIGISSLLMINTVSFSVLTQISSLFTKDAKFEIMMQYNTLDKNSLQLILSTDGVDDVYGSYSTRGVELKGQKYKIESIEGVDTSTYFSYWNTDIGSNRKALLEELDSGRNILLGKPLKDKLNLEIGDSITLNMARGEREYKVIGFFDTMESGGSYGITSARNLKADMHLQYYSAIYIKTFNNPDTVAKEIKRKFTPRSPWIMTMKELERLNINSNKQMFNILQGFSIMTLLIGILGIINNLMISFIERKRSLAMLRSIGMSKKQILKMIFIEAFTGGMVGGIVGLLTGIVMVSIVPYIMIAIGSPMPITINTNTLFYYFGAGIIIMLIASISPASKSSKLNIITSLKYE